MGTPRTRKRLLVLQKGGSYPETQGRIYTYGKLVSSYDFWVSGEQVTTDSLNGWKPEKRIPGVDVGGIFNSTKPFVKEIPEFVISSRNRADEHYRGIIRPVHASPNPNLTTFESLLTEAGVTADSWANLLSYGSTAISRCAPTNPVSNVGTFLGELRKDGLPVIGMGKKVNKGPKRPSTLRKKAGSVYLESEFAIRPFVSDLQRFDRAARESSKIIAQLVRDSGRLVRRRYSFPTEVDHSEQSISSTYVWPLLHTYWYDDGGSAGTLTKYTSKETRRWFSGSFTYYVNSGDRAIDKLLRTEQELHKLYGSISVDTVWNLLPWSWAVDWVSNMGDVVKNVSLFSRDGLVMPHGYIMEKILYKVTYVRRGLRFGKRVVSYEAIPPPSFSFTYGVESMRRRRATPFGFGITDTQFTGRQNAIIAALGLTRS